MKFVVAFAAAALGATAVAAYAHQGDTMFVRQGGPGMDMDSNHDGWLTRAEAAAGADRMFDELDTNHDGRLTDADRPREFHTRIIDPEHLPAPADRGCTRTANGDRVVIICNSDAAPRAEAGRHVEREVTIINRDGGDDDDLTAPEPPAPSAASLPPHAPHPPMFMMMMANADEMDANHDGAISREEFRVQQLRFFDASDANGDGRIRFEPPEPPLPPLPPVASVPPAPDVAPAAPVPPVAPRPPDKTRVYGL